MIFLMIYPAKSWPIIKRMMFKFTKAPEESAMAIVSSRYSLDANYCGIYNFRDEMSPVSSSKGLSVVDDIKMSLMNSIPSLSGFVGFIETSKGFPKFS
jgi:hypothetical protein